MHDARIILRWLSLTTAPMFLCACVALPADAPHTDRGPALKSFTSGSGHARDSASASRAAAVSALLPLGSVDQRSDESVIYTTQVASGRKLIIGAINLEPLGADDSPYMSVSWPNSSGASCSSERGIVFCTPASGDGGPVTVAVAVTRKSSASPRYGVFAQSADQATVASFDSLSLTGAALATNAITVYRIQNTDNSLKQRNLAFSSSATGGVAAMLYREDGELRCSSFRARPCEVYDADWSLYYLVVVNASGADSTYNIQFSR